MSAFRGENLIKWTDADDQFAIRKLRERLSVDVVCEALGERMGGNVTSEMLRHRFSRQKLKSPTAYIRESVDTMIDTRTFGDLFPDVYEPPPEKPIGVDLKTATEALKRGWFGHDSGFTTKLLIIPDAHHPFVDVNVWSLLLKVCRGWRPDHVVILGDFADCYAVSYFAKNPSRVNLLADELRQTKAALSELREAVGSDTRIDYLYGNHEYRFERYIADKAPALHGLVSLNDALGLPELGIHQTPYKQSLQVGKLRITHDFGKHGAGAVSDALDTAAGNAVIGHIHSMSVLYRGNALGDVHVGASFGWLGNFDAVDYRHSDKARREWSHGFGIGRMLGNGNVFLQAIPVVDKACVVEGTVYAQ